MKEEILRILGLIFSFLLGSFITFFELKRRCRTRWRDLTMGNYKKRRQRMNN